MFKNVEKINNKASIVFEPTYTNNPVKNEPLNTFLDGNKNRVFLDFNTRAGRKSGTELTGLGS